MKCEICEQEKHCVELDLEWTSLDNVCENCLDKYMSNGYVDYDNINKDKDKRLL